MKLIHAGDIHLDPRAPELALASLSKLYEHTVEHRPAAVLIAGDLFERAVPATDAAGMTDLIRLFRRMAAVTQVIASTGTPTHDRPGAYEPLGNSVTLADRKGVFVNDKLLVTATPEPRIEASDGDGDHESAEAAALERTREQLVQARHLYQRLLIPIHVHMHHGAIAAAATETGYYATGAPGELCLMPQDLDIPDAAYVALGHIHKQQRVEGCKTVAWYCGSAYPTDWGERDQKAALLVEIPDGGGDVRVSPLPYPHRPRRKYSVAIDMDNGAEFSTLIADAVVKEEQRIGWPAVGHDIWLQVTHPAEFSPTEADIGRVRALLGRASGDGEGNHRIEMRRAPREAVIRADLSDVPGWDDQLAAWLDSTGGAAPTDEQRKLALGLQRRTAGPGGGKPRAWRIDGLVLRSARGLAGGSIDLDLTKYPPGLLAISGPNGAGKTTILEHMCPWPELLTRGGSLNAAFSGAGARRELTVTETERGKKMTLFISVSASGKRHHAIYLDGEGEKQTDVLSDGTTGAYVAEVDRLFGERATYIAGAVQPQRPITLRLRGPDGTASSCTSDLIQAPAGMRRHLLRAILGLDAYQHGAEIARAMARDRGDELQRIEAQLDALPATDHAVYDEHHACETDAERAAERLSAVNAKLRELTDRQPAVRAEADKARRLMAHIEAARRDVKVANREKIEAENRAKDERHRARRLPELEAKYNEIQESSRVLHDLQERVERERLSRQEQLDFIEGRRQRRRDHARETHAKAFKAWEVDRDAVNDERLDREQAARDEHHAALAKWQKVVDAASVAVQELGRMEAVVADEKEKLEQAQANATRLNMPGQPCSVCGQPMGEDKREELLDQERMSADLHERRLYEAESALNRAVQDAPKPGPAPSANTPDLSDLDERLRALGPAPAPAEPDMSDLDDAIAEARKPTEHETRVLGQAAKHRDLNNEWRQMCGGDPEAMTRARLAEARAVSARDEAKRAEARVQEARERERAAQAELVDPDALMREERLVASIQAMNRDVQEQTRAHSTAVAELRIATAALEREQQLTARRRELSGIRKDAASTVADAKLLAAALAPTGIQALLLESAAPQIAADANAALADSYGERWQLRLELQRIAKDRIAEDLRIVVCDTESRAQPSDDQLGPGEQLAETLSGGEATWVRQALAGALALARARYTGQRQLTALIDEADGALSEDARVKYFDLLESQHRALGRHHTIVVTHSQEMLDRLGPERVIRLKG